MSDSVTCFQPRLSTHITYWKIVLCGSNGQNLLHLIPIERRDTVPSLTQKISNSLQRKGIQPRRWICRVFSFRKLAAYVAVVDNVSSQSDSKLIHPSVANKKIQSGSLNDLEADAGTEIFIESKHLDRALSYALNAPQKCRYDSSLLHTRSRIFGTSTSPTTRITTSSTMISASTAATSLASTQQDRVLLIQHELDRRKIIVFSILSVLLAAITGLVIGYATHNANTGMGIAAAIAGFMSCIQAIGFWVDWRNS